MKPFFISYAFIGLAVMVPMLLMVKKEARIKIPWFYIFFFFMYLIWPLFLLRSIGKVNRNR